MKLQGKLAFTMAAAASVAIFLMALASWVVAAQEQRRGVDDSLEDRVQQIRVLADPGRGGGRGGRIPRSSDPFDQGVAVRFRLVLPNGEAVIDDGLPNVDPVDKPTFSTIEIEGDRYRMLVSSAGRAEGATVQVAQNIEDIESGLDRLRSRLVVASILGIGLAALFGALVAKRLTTPIKEVSAAARDMALHQDLPSRITVDRSDEVGDLATSFNQMLAALEVSRDQQQRLVADASHELRTPLTSLRLKIDLLDSTPDLPEPQRQELLAGAAGELERLTDLVSELVELATDPTGVDEQPIEIDLGQLGEAVAEQVRRSSSRDIDVSATPVIVVVRQKMVGRAISNLLDNAVKYSADGSPVRLSIRGDGGVGLVEVQDRGEGIPPGDLEHVFDRFYRSPTARTRPGNGIGLAIVQRVAELHGGEVWARNNPVAEVGGATVGFSVASTITP